MRAAQNAEPYWLSDTEPLSLPKLEGNADFDVMVIGGGINGLSCALALVEEGAAPDRIAVLEARRIGERASGRNAGFLCKALPEPYHYLKNGLGASGAKRLVTLSDSNRATLKRWLREADVSEAFDACGALYLAASEHEESVLKESVRALAEDGFRAEWLHAKDASEGIQADTGFGACADPLAAACDPSALSRALVSLLLNYGVHLFEGSSMVELKAQSGGGVRVITSHGAAEVVRVVLAVNAYAGESDPSLRKMVAPTRGQMLSFAPLEGRERFLRPLVVRNHGFEYFRQDGNGRFFMGGMRYAAMHSEVGLEEKLEPRVQDRLQQFVTELYPQYRSIEPDRQWCGIMGFSCDGLPFIGPHPHRNGVLLSIGYTGYGLALCAEAGRMIAELVLNGRSTDATMFSPRRLL